MQYSALLTNPSLTSLRTSKNFNSDFLFTYQVNAWTALYVGYNSNLRDIVLASTDAGPRIVGNQDAFLNDGKQFFVKFSYLFRP
ncbi:MAG: hypothetical protein ACR2L2_10110 [Acidobacteriota bacterium]